jgi:serine/threonine protein kinase
MSMVRSPSKRFARFFASHPFHAERCLQSFRNEVVTWKCLRHPNIVPFLGISDIFPVCVVSEWMSGGTISAFLAEYPEENRLKYVCLCAISVYLTDLVSDPADHIWTGVYACPGRYSRRSEAGSSMFRSFLASELTNCQANVLVGENSNVRLADFGMATVLFNSPTLATTDTGDGVGGTMRFMAPELHAESTPDSCGPKLGIPTDIYALAMTIWEVHPCSSPHAAKYI